MSPATITLLFLLFAVVMFVWEKIPLGVTSMIVCVGLVITGVLDWKTAFSGFIDSNVILFVAMFIVGGALFETGMANKIGGVVATLRQNREAAYHSNHGDCGTDERSTFKHRNCSGSHSGSYRNCCKIRILEIETSYATCFFAAAMGGNLSLIGALGNLIAQSAMGEIGLSFGFSSMQR